MGTKTLCRWSKKVDTLLSIFIKIICINILINKFYLGFCYSPDLVSNEDYLNEKHEFATNPQFKINFNQLVCKSIRTERNLHVTKSFSCIGID